jgi:hypothetical protein
MIVFIYLLCPCWLLLQPICCFGFRKDSSQSHTFILICWLFLAMKSWKKTKKTRAQVRPLQVLLCGSFSSSRWFCISQGGCVSTDASLLAARLELLGDGSGSAVVLISWTFDMVKNIKLSHVKSFQCHISENNTLLPHRVGNGAMARGTKSGRLSVVAASSIASLPVRVVSLSSKKMKWLTTLLL